MEFEELFAMYLNEWAVEIEQEKNLKVYKAILKDIKFLFYAAYATQKSMQKNRKKLEREYLSIQIQFPSIRKSDISENVKKAISSYNRLITFSYAGEKALNTYLKILESLHNITTEYYKEMMPKSKKELLFLRVLVEIIAESYQWDVHTFDKTFAQITKALEVEQIPILDYEYHVYLLKDFLLQKISGEEDFNFNRFQKEIMER